MLEDRGYREAPPTAYDSAVSSCLHSAWLSFASMSHCDLLLQVPSGRRSEEPTSPWDCSPISMLQLPAAMLSRGLASLPGVCMGIFPTQGSNSNRIVCVIVIPFRRSQISCFTLQQPQMLHLCPKQLPRCGDLTPASVPSPPHVQIHSYSLSSVSPFFLCPAEICMVLYIPFP